MKNEPTNGQGSILVPVLAAGAIAAGLAFLFAPKSGTELRRDLKRVADHFSQAVDIGRDLYGEGKEFVSKAAEAGKKAYAEERPLEPVINRKSSLIVPILASGIIGAGLALLLSPKSGAAIRNDLRRFASSAGEQVVSAVDKGKDIFGSDKIEYFEGKEPFEHAV
jgi:gas vesicle protein